jgi:hypothetical protein
MWVFTETGFVSAVRKPEEPKYITVRAREKQSLEVLSELAEKPIIGYWLPMRCLRPGCPLL